MEKTPQPFKDKVDHIPISIITVQLQSILGDPIATYEQKVKKFLEPHKGKPIDLIVLPELALTGYDFLEDYEKVFSLSEIQGEEKANDNAKTHYQMAKEISLEYGAYVAIGYPERELMTQEMKEDYESEIDFNGEFGPTYIKDKSVLKKLLPEEAKNEDEIEISAKPRLYCTESSQYRMFNSCYIIDRKGDIVLNYRKILLYATDKRYFHPGNPNQNRTFELETKLK